MNIHTSYMKSPFVVKMDANETLSSVEIGRTGPIPELGLYADGGPSVSLIYPCRAARHRHDARRKE